ncbi:TPA: YtxH domain-containing protein, partial [Enterococcus faecium]|nr:YtxH domain-containing protein [Enterococcus faecium]
MAKKGGFLLGAVVGGTAAAIAALLLAPKSGKELRDELAAQADDLMDMASDY